ncbi:MAG: FHA domain-containing protein [Magnetococcales bacterium]|nr:FHA domain-containing protein [Magnetococcales bacterium]
MGTEKEAGQIQRLLTSTGRIEYGDLKGLAEENNEQRFVQLVRAHCLVGVEVVTGEIKDDPKQGSHTMLFRAGHNLKRDRGQQDFDLSQVIFPLVNRRNSRNNDHFTVGQNDDNDIVISDYSVSREHLVIRVNQRGLYFLTDLGSKNSTLIQDKICPPNKEQEITAGDHIQIGRYQFVFLSPSMLYARLIGLNVQKTFMELINHLGKADYVALKKVADLRGEAVFMQLVQNPALVGVGLFKGYLVNDDEDEKDETKLFLNENQDQHNVVSMKYLTRNIFPILHRSESSRVLGYLTIGRQESSDICMEDNSISREHARIGIPAEGHYIFIDCGSRNGSRINDEKLTKDEERALSEGDQVKIGRYMFTFVFPSTLFNMLKNRK